MAELQRLLEISHAIVSGISHEALVAKVLEGGLDTLNGDAAAAWLVSDQGHLRCMDCRGLSADYVERLSALSISDTICGRVAFEVHPIALADMQHEVPPASRAITEREQLIAFMGAPVINADQVIGVLAVYYRQEASAQRTFNNPDAIRLLTGYADLLAMGIANRRLQQQNVSAVYAFTRQKELLDRLVKNAQDGIVVLDQQRHIVLWSPACERILGWRASEVLGLPFETVLHAYSPGSLSGAAGDPAALNLINSDKPVPSMELHIHNRSGKQGWISASWAPIYEGRRDNGESNGNQRGGVMILRDITEAKEVERAKSSLISMVGHELRTPLTAIRALSELLRDHSFPKDRQQEIVRGIYDDAVRLNRLVDQVLDAAKIEAGKMPFTARPTELLPLFKQAAQAIGAGFKREVQISAPPNLPPVLADPDRLRQILDNLLANAATYSPAGTPVRISASAGYDRVTISVSDQGAGISADHIPRIWERFYRVEDLDTRRTSGTGLGLHIVKALVELHKGTISVESTPGSGSTFRVTLPRA